MDLSEFVGLFCLLTFSLQHQAVESVIKYIRTICTFIWSSFIDILSSDE